MRVAVTVDRHKWEGHAQARSGVALREALDERGRERRAEGASHRALTRPFSAIAPCLSSRRPRGCQSGRPACGGAKVDARRTPQVADSLVLPRYGVRLARAINGERKPVHSLLSGGLTIEGDRMVSQLRGSSARIVLTRLR